MRYYLNISLPDDLEAAVTAIEVEWQGSSRSAPHLSIVRPGTLDPESSEEDLIHIVRESGATIKPFEVHYGDVGYFNGKSTIYLKVRPTRPLVAAHRLLSLMLDTVLEPNGPKKGSLYIPHITLASHLSGPKAQAAWKALRSLPLSGKFICSDINLLRIDSHDKYWQLVATFPLGELLAKS